MSGTKEAYLWRWLSGARPHFGPSLHMTRIENRVSAGMPDVEGHLDGDRLHPHGQFWIELKAIARPANKSTAISIGLRSEQAAWLVRRWSVGGLAWILIQVGSGRDRKMYLVPGKYAHMLFQKRVNENVLADLAWTSTTETGPHPAHYISRTLERPGPIYFARRANYLE